MVFIFWSRGYLEWRCLGWSLHCAIVRDQQCLAILPRHLHRLYLLPKQRIWVFVFQTMFVEHSIIIKLKQPTHNNAFHLSQQWFKQSSPWKKISKILGTRKLTKFINGQILFPPTYNTQVLMSIQNHMHIRIHITKFLVVHFIQKLKTKKEPKSEPWNL